VDTGVAGLATRSPPGVTSGVDTGVAAVVVVLPTIGGAADTGETTASTAAQAKASTTVSGTYLLAVGNRKLPSPPLNVRQVPRGTRLFELSGSPVVELILFMNQELGKRAKFPW
jgi:hypothetical protein